MLKFCWRHLRIIHWYSFFRLVNHEKIYWGRDCIDDRETQIGCEQKVYNGSEIEVCVCRGEGCNKEMGDVSTSTAKPTTTHKGIKHFLMLYFSIDIHKKFSMKNWFDPFLSNPRYWIAMFLLLALWWLHSR